MQLYDSLIVSRLMYACSVWMDVSKSQLQQLEALIIKHHRQMANIGFWTDMHMTDVDLRHHLEIRLFASFGLDIGLYTFNILDDMQHISTGNFSLPNFNKGEDGCVKLQQTYDGWQHW